MIYLSIVHSIKETLCPYGRKDTDNWYVCITAAQTTSSDVPNKQCASS
jgi:hypothetical protein